MSEMLVGRGELIIKTNSIGSCLVIVIYDKEKKIGGMVHAMLPQKPTEPTQSGFHDASRARYVDTAIHTMVEEVLKLGAERTKLQARIIGGAKMFNALGLKNNSVGSDNIEAAHKLLTELVIPIKSQDTGGTIGRIASFNLASGIIEVSTRM